MQKCYERGSYVTRDIHLVVNPKDRKQKYVVAEVKCGGPREMMYRPPINQNESADKTSHRQTNYGHAFDAHTTQQRSHPFTGFRR
jgi:hypothetical protein